MLSCFIAVLQPRNTERGGKKKHKGENKNQTRDATISATCKGCCGFCHLWNTADTAAAIEETAPVQH